MDLDLQFIEKTTYGIQVYVVKRGKEGYDRVLFEDMICYIMEVLNMWTGQTWVGYKKDKIIESVFQQFFAQLNSLICYMDCFNEMMSDDEKEFVVHAKYTGVIYRYLGSGNLDNREYVEIEYNDIYVSWSKNEKTSYIESKLFGPWLLVKARTMEFDYGIDLEGIDEFYHKITGRNVCVVKGNEREVVYPTIENSILEVIKNSTLSF